MIDSVLFLSGLELLCGLEVLFLSLGLLQPLLVLGSGKLPPPPASIELCSRPGRWVHWCHVTKAFFAYNLLGKHFNVKDNSNCRGPFRKISNYKRKVT